MWELFVFGSFGFWTLMIIATVILMICLENNAASGATFVFIGSLFLLDQFGNLPILSIIHNNPLITILSITAYFAVGTVWSVAKWFFYVRNEKQLYDEMKQKFIAFNKIDITINDPIPDNWKQKWKEQTTWRLAEHERIDINPKINEHKAQIYMWISYWPLSLVWTMIDDPIRKILKNIYKNISDWLQSISDRYFKDVKKDFE